MKVPKNGFVAVLDSARSPGELVLSASLDMWWFSGISPASFALLAGTIVSTGNGLLKSVLFSTLAGSLESAFTAWSFMTSQWTKSNSYWDKRRNHCASFPDACAMFKTQPSAS